MFEERGLGNPANNLVAFEGPLAPFGHQLFNQTFLFKKSPWTAEELRMLTEHLGVGNPARWFGQSPKIYYSPGISRLYVKDHRSNDWSVLFAEVLTAPDLSAFYAAHRQQFAPATDDRPFFNQTIRWAGLRPGDFYRIFVTGTHGSVLGQPVAANCDAVSGQRNRICSYCAPSPPPRAPRIANCAAMGVPPLLCRVGLGFIMIEIVLIQRFLLFLGEPVYTFAVVLAGLLGFTGIGSWISGRFGENTRFSLMWIIPAILLVLLLTAIASPWIFTSALGLPLPWRIVIVVAMLAPLGIFLGMPFPTGLRIVTNEAPAFIPWVWGVNGFFTVVGSIGASILGMAFGFTAMLAGKWCVLSHRASCEDNGEGGAGTARTIVDSGSTRPLHAILSHTLRDLVLGL